MYIKEKVAVYKVDADDILYLQQEGRDVKIVTEKRTYTLRRRKIKDVEGEVLSQSEGGAFFKCHSYLIVNTKKLSQINKIEAIFENGESVGMCYAASLRLRKMLKTI